MFRGMRRKDRALSDERAREILKNGDFGVLSTVGENGYAYGIPVNYGYMEDAIYFHCATEGYKLDNIAFNDKVSFCVIGKTLPLPETFSYSYESVVAFGRAQEVTGDEKQQALLALVSKYSAAFMEKGREYIKKDHSKTTVIKITIEHLTAKHGR